MPVRISPRERLAHEDHRADCGDREGDAEAADSEGLVGVDGNHRKQHPDGRAHRANSASIVSTNGPVRTRSGCMSRSSRSGYSTRGLGGSSGEKSERDVRYEVRREAASVVVIAVGLLAALAFLSWRND